MFSQVQQSWAGWSELWQEQLGRFESLHARTAELQQQGAERTAEVIDEMARLTKASMEHFQHVGAEYQRVTLEAWRRGAALLTSAPSAAEG
ncbi:MAG: hypothetical protein KDK70_00435 [Myxococcales bacterium]|nr:hypothetical protein [Myxococcales bacterium]